MTHAADERPDVDAVFVGRLDGVCRHRAERVHEHLHAVALEAQLDLAREALTGLEPGSDRRVVGVGRKRGNVVVGEQLLDELPMPLGDHLHDLLDPEVAVVFSRRHELRWDHEVNAVRLAVDVLVDPVELDLELLRAEGQGAEDAEAAGATHRGDDVAAVAEREDRELESVAIAEVGVHGGPLWPMFPTRMPARLDTVYIVRVGVVILPEHRWSSARDLWQRAEQLGFDHAWTYDHLAVAIVA